MKTRIFLIIFSIIHTISALTLEGNWTLTIVQSQKVQIDASIDKYIFRSSLIMNRLHFQTCNSLSYQVNIDQDNFWVNLDSELINTSSSCSEDDITITQLVRETIRSVLTFEIIVDQLHLYNPSSEPMMVFTRSKINNQKQAEINGIWIVNFNIEGDTTTSHQFVVGNSTIECNGAVYKFTTTSPYAISLTLESGSNRNKQIDQAIQKIKYFKRHDAKIAFYDSSINLISSGIINSQYSISPTQTSTQNARSNTELAAAQPVQKNAPIGLTAGNYILLLLYRRDLMRVKLQMSATTMQLTLCTKLVFNYVLNSPSDIAINSASTPNHQCSKGDESIYYNYITSAASYTVDSDGLITLIDSSKKSIVSLALQ